MTQHDLVDRLARPACPSVAAGEAALKDAARRARARWPREGARPSLTAAPPAASRGSGRGRKTALLPNRKTLRWRKAGRTTHPLQTADIFTRHRHRGVRPCRARGGGGDAVGAPARGTIPASALLAIAVLIGVVDGLAQPAVYGEAALLPSKFTQAVCAGTAASGALTSLIRIITKAAFDNGDKSSAAGGTKALTAFFGTSAVECAAAAVLFACVLPRTRAARSLAAGHAEARASLLKGSQVSFFFLNFRAEVESSVDGKPHSSTLKALSLSLHCLSLLFRFVFLLFRNETLHRPRARWRCQRWCPPRRRRRKKRQQQQQQQQQQQHQQQQRKKRSLKKTPPPTPPPRRRPKGSPRPPATPLPRAGASRATCGPAPRPWSRSTG